ncbi:MAG: PIN domain-containing protein [Candidatus Bathyarchaeia archaeon]
MTNRRKAVYDTSFFATLYYSKNPDEKERIKRELAGRRGKYVSAVNIYEVYKLSVQTDGREAADLRVSLLEKDFKVVDVDSRIARDAAAIWFKYRVPMADAIIAATAELLKAECVTNDQHLTSIREVRSRWI